MLPAIVFVFSRAGCDQAVQQCLAAGLRLTDPAERAQIRAIAEAKTESLADDDLDVLRYDSWLAGLEAGFAAHHAGMVPPMKEAVEEAFAAGLAKVVFATETLALGINMPARSVVIEKVSKFTGERHEFLTPGEYTQLTGRAGRRGIDERGYAIVCWSPFVPFEQVASLASRRTDALRSSFRPTYNMAANLVRRYSQFEAHHLLNLSFAQFHADRDVVALERQLDRSRQHARAPPSRRRQSDAGDVEEYRAPHRASSMRAARIAGGSRRVAEALEVLRPGDVVVSRRYGGRRRRPEPRAPAERLSRGSSGSAPIARSSGSAPTTSTTPPRRAASIQLPDPFAPRNPAFRRQAAERLRRATLHDDGARPRRADARIAELERRLAEPPGGARSAARARLRGAEAIERLERDVNRLERRVRGRSESLARQFDRVLRVLEAWGYLDGWTLTPAGERLARVYTETDLLVTEAIGEGLLDGLRVARARRPRVVLHLRAARPRRPAADAPGALAHQDGRPAGARRSSGSRTSSTPTRTTPVCPRPALPDPGFTPYVYDWAAGDAARRRARRRRDDRRRLRAQRQAVHRPAAPDRRRARPRTPPGTVPETRPTRATAVSWPPRAWPDEHRPHEHPEGRTVGAPGDRARPTSPSRVATSRWRPQCSRIPHARVAFPADAIRLRAGGRALRRPGATGVAVRRVARRARHRELLAVNMVVVGVPPDRQRWWNGAQGVVVKVDDRVAYDGGAVAVVVANGQYLRGVDVVPRGHPGDGRIEGQVYDVARRERAAMRRRLPLGTHVPHPRIRPLAGRRVEIRADRDGRWPWRSTADRPHPPARGRRGRPGGLYAAGVSTTDTGPRSGVGPPIRSPVRSAAASEGERQVASRERAGPGPYRATMQLVTEAEAVGVYPMEQFTDDEEAILRPYFTNLDRPVFGVVNLPEVVKGALFARYSRSPKSLRRLFLDEFVADLDLTGDLTVDADVGLKRAEELYERIFLEYGDDSVAQLGGVHLACEQASNVLTKILEWGRVMSYMEQSTRYIPYDGKLGGRYRYYRDRAVLADPELAWRYIADLDGLFDTYTGMLPKLLDWARERYPKDPADSHFVYKQSIRAKACDAARGILPAATLSNVGVYGSGQAFEALLLRMRAHPLPEAQAYATMMLEELRKVIPSFVARVDRLIVASRGAHTSPRPATTRRISSIASSAPRSPSRARR